MQQYYGHPQTPRPKSKPIVMVLVVVAVMGGMMVLLGAGCFAYLMFTGSPPKLTETAVTSCKGQVVQGGECLLRGGSPKLIAVDDQAAYVVYSYDVTLRRVDLQGQEVTTLVSSEKSILGLALDRRDVYFIDSDQRELRRVPKSGGSPEVVAQVKRGGTLRADPNHEGRICLLSNGSVLCTPARGEPLRVVSSRGLRQVQGYVLDGESVYISYELSSSDHPNVMVTRHEIERTTVTGGTAELVSKLGPCTMMSVDDTHVYCVNGTRVFVVDKSGASWVKLGQIALLTRSFMTPPGNDYLFNDHGAVFAASKKVESPPRLVVGSKDVWGAALAVSNGSLYVAEDHGQGGEGAVFRVAMP
ncbi:MAG: hypothetical protein KIS78_02975 [Labilithrix sp.]|nr:hypothetical protein [Labilithrix sp.]